MPMRLRDPLILVPFMTLGLPGSVAVLAFVESGWFVVGVLLDFVVLLLVVLGFIASVRILLSPLLLLRFHMFKDHSLVP